MCKNHTARPLGTRPHSHPGRRGRHGRRHRWSWASRRTSVLAKLSRAPLHRRTALQNITRSMATRTSRARERGGWQRHGCLQMVRHDAEHAVEDARGPLSLSSWHGTGPGPRFQYVGTLRWSMSKKWVVCIYKVMVYHPRPVSVTLATHHSHLTTRHSPLIAHHSLLTMAGASSPFSRKAGRPPSARPTPPRWPRGCRCYGARRGLRAPVPEAPQVVTLVVRRGAPPRDARLRLRAPLSAQ